MKRHYLKLMIIVNIMLMLLYVCLLHIGTNDYMEYTFGIFGYLEIAIPGTIVNIIALLVMWFSGVKAKKIIKVYIIGIGICVCGIVLCYLLNTLLFLLPMALILVIIYSLIFQAIVCGLETNNYSYIGYLIIPIMWFLIFLKNVLF